MGQSIQPSVPEVVQPPAGVPVVPVETLGLAALILPERVYQRTIKCHGASFKITFYGEFNQYGEICCTGYTMLPVWEGGA